MAEYGVRLERRGRVALITFDRPERRNAFNDVMWSGLERSVAELKEHLPRAVVVTGAGKAFCAGFDINPDNPQVSGLIGSVQTKERPPVEQLIQRLQTARERPGRAAGSRPCCHQWRCLRRRSGAGLALRPPGDGPRRRKSVLRK